MSDLPPLKIRSGKLHPDKPRTAKGGFSLQLQAAERDAIYQMMRALPEGIASASGIARRCLRAGIPTVMAELGIALDKDKPDGE